MSRRRQNTSPSVPAETLMRQVNPASSELVQQADAAQQVEDLIRQAVLVCANNRLYGMSITLCQVAGQINTERKGLIKAAGDDAEMIQRNLGGGI